VTPMKKDRQHPRNAGGTPVDRRVRRHAALWRDSEGNLEEVRSDGRVTRLVRGAGYVRFGSIACELRDTGNGFIARFPAHGSTDQDKYVCLDYDDARNLVLALTPHAKDLGFDA
jgi:hypothetical protein